MDWLPIVAVAAPVVASLGTLWFSNSHADKADERKLKAERERWEFEARERRFENRLEAVVAFDVAVSDSSRASYAWYLEHTLVEHPPADAMEALEAAYARARVLVAPEAVAATDELYGAALHGLLGKGSEEVFATQGKYRKACQAMLAERPERI